MKFALGSEPRTVSTVPIKVPHQEADSASVLSSYLKQYFDRDRLYRPLVIVCIGTDRSTGDSLGPIIGSRLAKLNLNNVHLYGTLDDPVHAMNLSETMSLIQDTFNNPYVIAIDACLGQLASVGHIQLGNGPLKPGAGVNKELPAVGDIHMTGIVNVGGFMEYFVLQNTRLSLVMRMAEVMSKSIVQALSSSASLAPDLGSTRFSLPLDL